MAHPCWLSGTASSTHRPCLSPQQEQVRELTAWSYKHSVHTSQPHTYSYLRADFRQSLVEAAEVASDYFRTTWRPVNRPRVTNSFRSACTWIRAPFVVAESLPQARDVSQRSNPPCMNRTFLGTQVKHLNSSRSPWPLRPPLLLLHPDTPSLSHVRPQFRSFACVCTCARLAPRTLGPRSIRTHPPSAMGDPCFAPLHVHASHMWLSPQKEGGGSFGVRSRTTLRVVTIK